MVELKISFKVLVLTYRTHSIYLIFCTDMPPVSHLGLTSTFLLSVLINVVFYVQDSATLCKVLYK